MGEPAKANPVASDYYAHEKMANMPVVDKVAVPPQVSSSRAGSRHSDGAYVALSGREAAARHMVSGSVNQTGGKEGDPPVVRNSMHVPPELAAPAGAESVGTPRTTAISDSPVGAESSSIRSPAQSVGEQILESIRGSITRGEQQLSIRLRPPELGTVCVRFTERSAEIHGVLEVDQADTRREIERALPDVLQTLQDMGVPIRRLEVTVAESPQREPGREQLQQDSWQQGSDRSHDESQRSGSTGRPAYDGSPQTVPDYPEAAAVLVGGSAGRIDMLM
jgi:flagellar hook-length control protein FliK